MDRTPSCSSWFFWTSEICQFVFKIKQVWDRTISCIFSGMWWKMLYSPNRKRLIRYWTHQDQQTERASCCFGLSQFLQTFHAQICHFLTDATRKGAPNRFEFSDAQIQTFATLKQHIVNPPILRLADLQRTFILQTDACDTGVGGVFFKKMMKLWNIPSHLPAGSYFRVRQGTLPSRKNVSPLFWKSQSFRSICMAKNLFTAIFW